MSVFNHDYAVASSGWRLPKFTYNPNNLTLVFDTSKEPANNTVSVLLNGAVNCAVDWGDSLSNSYTSSGWKTHTYDRPGIYVVQISGTMTNFGFTTSPAINNNKLKLVRCLSFGNSVQTFSSAFANCTNLVQCPPSIPATVTNLADTFYGCSNFNDPNVSLWNTANVTNFASVFRNCSRFNVPLNNWNVSNATIMSSMFSSCSKFNQPLNSWSVENVFNFSGMFATCSVFNQPLNSWNVSSALNMSQMFLNANAFSHDLSSWDIRGVTNMTSFFGNANSWGANNYSNALIAWAALADTALLNRAITNISLGNSSRIRVLTNTDPYPLSWDVGRRARISGTTNYNGDYNILAKPQFLTFEVAQTFVGQETTGTAELFRSRNVTLDVGTQIKYLSSAADARNQLISQYGWSITDGGLQT